MKRFLLTAGQTYYPQPGAGDWIDTFDSRDEAEAIVKPQFHKAPAYMKGRPNGYMIRGEHHN